MSLVPVLPLQALMGCLPRAALELKAKVGGT